MRLWQGVASRSIGGISSNSELAKMTVGARIDAKIQRYLGVSNKTGMQRGSWVIRDAFYPVDIQ